MSDGPELTPEDVKEILRVIDESGYDEFELETPRFAIRFSRSGVRPHASEASAPPSSAPPSSPAPAPASVPEGLVDITSPMVGTLHRSPSPGQPAFVEVGRRVDSGAQLCIIEVMKLMNAVTATVGGTIAEVCFETGASVQYGEVLFRIQADD
ncbi:MAG TPA: biotin/lipoyl-containing protein [Gaiellaceae bacterium]